MNASAWLLWGFGATLVLTVVLQGCQAFGISRLSLPYVLGTMVTAGRDRAKLYGFFMHLGVGWIVALLYVATFEQLGAATALRGALVGTLHALIVLLGLFPLLPAVHPRMASETQGPEASRNLEPPGALGLHYGASTPIATIVAHALYGAILGALYTVR